MFDAAAHAPRKQCWGELEAAAARKAAGCTRTTKKNVQAVLRQPCAGHPQVTLSYQHGACSNTTNTTRTVSGAGHPQVTPSSRHGACSNAMNTTRTVSGHKPPDLYGVAHGLQQHAGGVHVSQRAYGRHVLRNDVRGGRTCAVALI